MNALLEKRKIIRIEEEEREEESGEEKKGYEGHGSIVVRCERVQPRRTVTSET